jgi:hypothetical protein
MEAVRTSETSVDNYFTRQYIPEDYSEHHTRHRENLKSHKKTCSKILQKCLFYLNESSNVLDTAFSTTPAHILLYTGATQTM